MPARQLPDALAALVGAYPNGRMPILDHGYIEILDVMGDDDAVVEGARVSISGEGVRPVSEDRALIRYLFRSRHTTPFEMAELKIRVKLPIFVERQWIRHRMANTNEMSARYSVLPEEYYVPPADQVCYQATDNKQGRAGPVPALLAEQFRDGLRKQSARAFLAYNAALDLNDAHDSIARETARIGLPLGTYTEKVWKCDLHNLLHFSGLRMDAHAQWEVRQYANQIGEILAAWVPLTFEAFEDYRLHAVTFSRQEMELLRAMVGEWASRIRGAPVHRQEPEGPETVIEPPDPVITELKPKMTQKGLSVRERGAFLRALGLIP